MMWYINAFCHLNACFNHGGLKVYYALRLQYLRYGGTI